MLWPLEVFGQFILGFKMCHSQWILSNRIYAKTATPSNKFQWVENLYDTEAFPNNLNG